ncbi:MAG: alpha/beta fold hydrolase [Ideonella sp.]|jgi:hypothetical protein|nr:alpha/beta fold hydrolase [Ideonella sp.]
MTLAATVLAAYAALLAGLWWGQERLIFLPSTLPAEHRFLVADDVHEVWVDVPGARLNALHLRLPRPAGVVFFLHGNAGHLGSWFVDIGVYRELGYDLFMLDYRGYGKSTGQIESEAQLLADVQAAWASIAPRYAGQPVVFFGRSLGTGLATRLAAALPPAERPDLLLLVSPFQSLEAMAREHYPFVPVSLLRYPMRSDAALQALAQAPGGGPRVVLVHGERDDIIRPAHARALSALSPGSRLEWVPGAGHNDLQSFDGYRAVIRSALADALLSPADRSP